MVCKLTLFDTIISGQSCLLFTSARILAQPNKAIVPVGGSVVAARCEHLVPVGGGVVAARKEHPSKDRNEYSTRPPRRDWGGGALLRLLLGGSRRREAELVVGGTAGMTSDEKKVAFRQLYHAISRVNSFYIIEKYNSFFVCH